MHIMFYLILVKNNQSILKPLTYLTGIRVNSVNPGPVATDFFDNMNFENTLDDIGEMTALKRVSTSEEIAELILYLAGDKAQGITGSIMVTDNGYLLKN